MSNFFLHIKNGVLVRNSKPYVAVEAGTRRATLFGSVEFIADYNEFTLSRSQEGHVLSTLERFCLSKDPAKDVNFLTDLVGPFVVTVQEGTSLRYIYRSDDIETPSYWASAAGGVAISTSWLEVLEWLGNVEVSEPDLVAFLSGSCQYPRSFFKGLYRLEPYSLYELSAGNLSLLVHSFPGLHTVDASKPPQYTMDHYFKALGCFKEHFESFSLAYSGGVDSNILAMLYADKVSELVTVGYEKPYRNLNRQKETIASRQMAGKYGAACTEVLVDLADTKKLQPYFHHYVRSTPFSTYLAVHYYALSEKSAAPVILHGQNADNIWDWGFHQIYFSKRKPHSTSASYILSRIAKDAAILRDRSASVKTKVRRIANRYLIRGAMMRSNKRVLLRRLVERVRPFGPEYDSLANFPYKMFALQRYIKYCTVGESLSWSSAARYASKRSLAPYVSPLALHVNSHIRRTNFFDMKEPFRRYSSEADPSTMDTDVTEKIQYDNRSEAQSPLFDQGCNIGLDFLSPMLNTLISGSSNRIARYHAQCVFEAVNLARLNGATDLRTKHLDVELSMAAAHSQPGSAESWHQT